MKPSTTRILVVAIIAVLALAMLAPTASYASRVGSRNTALGLAGLSGYLFANGRTGAGVAAAAGALIAADDARDFHRASFGIDYYSPYGYYYSPYPYYYSPYPYYYSPYSYSPGFSFYYFNNGHRRFDRDDFRDRDRGFRRDRDWGGHGWGRDRDDRGHRR
jgi:hypothetical protein